MNKFSNLVRMSSGSEELKKIRENESYINQIYEQHRSYTLNYFSRSWSNIDEETLVDAYQNSMIVLLENSRDSSFELTCNVQTYLNSIVLNQLRNIKKKPILLPVNDNEIDENIKDWYDEFNDVGEDRIKLLEDKLNKLKEMGGNCYEIIIRFWYKKQRLSQIAKEMGYTNADNVANQKSRCQRKLKSMMISNDG